MSESKIYYAMCLEYGLVKIGISENPEKKVSQLNSDLRSYISPPIIFSCSKTRVRTTIDHKILHNFLSDCRANQYNIWKGISKTIYLLDRFKVQKIIKLLRGTIEEEYRVPAHQIANICRLCNLQYRTYAEQTSTIEDFIRTYSSLYCSKRCRDKDLENPINKI